jgi:hypothetical protein
VKLVVVRRAGVIAGFFLCSLFPASAQEKDANLFFFVLPKEFSVVGQWTPSDPKDKNSMPRETQIDCFRQTNECVEADAEYYMERAHVTVSYSRILKWDSTGIIAVDDSGTCVSRTIIVSFASKSLSATYSPKKLLEKQKEACKFFGMKDSDSARFIVKNSQEWIKSHSYFPDEDAK